MLEQLREIFSGLGTQVMPSPSRPQHFGHLQILFSFNSSNISINMLKINLLSLNVNLIRFQLEIEIFFRQTNGKIMLIEHFYYREKLYI